MKKITDSFTRSQNFTNLAMMFITSLILIIITAMSGCTVAASAPETDPAPTISAEDIYFQTNAIYNNPIAIVSNNTIIIKNIKNRLTSSSETLSVSIVDVVHEGGQPEYVAEPSTFTIPAHELNPDGISSTNIEVAQIIAILPTALNRRGLSRRILYKVAVDLKGLVQVKLSGNTEDILLTEGISFSDDVTLKPCANYPPTLTVLEGGLPTDAFQPSISKNVDPYQPGATRASLKLMENNNLYSEFAFDVNVQDCLANQDISFAFSGPHANLYDTLGAAASVSSNIITISNLKNRHDFGDLDPTHPLSQIDAHLHVTVQDQDNAPGFIVATINPLTLASDALNPAGITAGTYPLSEKVTVTTPDITEGLTYDFELDLTALRVLKLSGDVYDTFFYEDVFISDVIIKPCHKTYAPTAAVLIGETVLSTVTTTVSAPSVPINPYEVGVAAQGTAILNENGSPIETYSFDIVVPPCTLKSPTGNIVGMTGVRGNLNNIGSDVNPWNIDSDLRLDLASRMITDSNADYGGHHYTLTEDIDLSVVEAPWSESSTHSQPRTTGFAPIDNLAGTFNCDNNEISNLFIDNRTLRMGLFITVQNTAIIRGCTLTSPQVITHSDRAGVIASYLAGRVEDVHVKDAVLTGRSRTGGLVAENTGSIVDSSFTRGTITGREDTGGLVGISYQSAAINNSSVSGGSVTGGGRRTGGFVGRNYGSIDNASFTGGTVSGGISTGGLVGINYDSGSIINASFTGMSVSGNSATGGVVGANHGSISNTFFKVGSVNGNFGVGGLVGINRPSSTVYDSYAYVDSDVEGVVYVGGLVGDVEVGSIISNSHARINAVLKGTSPSSRLGGLVGQLRGSIDNSYAILTSSGEIIGQQSIGGLVGYTHSTSSISNSYAHISSLIESSHSSSRLGGLVGWLHGSIDNSYAILTSSGEIIGQQSIGGLVGYTHSTSSISDSYAHIGSLIESSHSSSRLGGLVGWLHGSIDNSYAITTGSARIEGNQMVGGLVGIGEAGHIINSYANVALLGSSQLGGLVGNARRNLDITNSYAIGEVAERPSARSVGGFVGTASSITVLSSYWDPATTMQSASPDGVSRTTAQMQVAAPVFALPPLPLPPDAVYVGWDSSIWRFTAGEYPRLLQVVCPNRQSNPTATSCDPIP
ncbi:hypothetical protein COTS27_00996 [Spirochaetota bacterium]|nr:hypothetical protein COTS27_00996 [Spirochaetota bacterium]